MRFSYDYVRSLPYSLQLTGILITVLEEYFLYFTLEVCIRFGLACVYEICTLPPNFDLSRLHYVIDV